MESKMQIGATVALVSCPAYEGEGNTDVKVSGLWVIEEFLPYEPANYVHSPVFALSDGVGLVYVDADVLTEQVCPDVHARMLVAEREWEHYEEDSDDN